MFVDKAIIKVKAGDGGDGCCSFRREKFVPKGGPDGGDGGPGGNIIVQTAIGEQSLADYIYNRHFTAERGPHGKGKDMHGRKGRDTVLKVPMGTIIRDLATGEVVCDLNKPDERIIVAQGGRGGRGNTRFASSTNRAPRICEEGNPGEEKELELELKIIADIGLVGYPNAGKSTLLRGVSNAHPKVAPYPFTTLHPIVGTMDFPDYAKITVADIPGLIDGAHLNIGLGHGFLKHIERTRMLAFVLDMAGVDGRTPWDDLVSLQNELELYMKGLSKRPSVVLANKMDLPESEENLRTLREKMPNLELLPISAEKDESHDNVKLLFRGRLESLKG